MQGMHTGLTTCFNSLCLLYLVQLCGPSCAGLQPWWLPWPPPVLDQTLNSMNSLIKVSTDDWPPQSLRRGSHNQPLGDCTRHHCSGRSATNQCRCLQLQTMTYCSRSLCRLGTGTPRPGSGCALHPGRADKKCDTQPGDCSTSRGWASRGWSDCCEAPALRDTQCISNEALALTQAHSSDTATSRKLQHHSHRLHRLLAGLSLHCCRPRPSYCWCLSQKRFANRYLGQGMRSVFLRKC